MPPVFELPHALVFWLVFGWSWMGEWRLYREAVSTPHEQLTQDKGTCHLIVRALQILIPAAFVLAIAARFAAISDARIEAFYAGVVALAAGSALRRHCIRLLGRSFTYGVRVSREQSVVTTGAYRYVRHPSYSGGMLMHAGLGLALTNWISFALLTIVPAVLYWIRVSVEERALLDTIGEPYRAYMARTKRFIPFVV